MSCLQSLKNVLFFNIKVCRVCSFFIKLYKVDMAISAFALWRNLVLKTYWCHFDCHFVEISVLYKRKLQRKASQRLWTKYLATARNANSTFWPLFADVSIKATLYSRAKRSPSSRLTALSEPQSALFPAKFSKSIYAITKLGRNDYIKQILLKMFES